MKTVFVMTYGEKVTGVYADWGAVVSGLGTVTTDGLIAPPRLRQSVRFTYLGYECVLTHCEVSQ